MEKILKIWDRFDASDVSELMIETNEFKMHLKRSTEGIEQPAVTKVESPLIIEKTEKPKTISGESVKAPLAGLFYRAQSPDQDPFVKVGTKVKKGDVIGIIEAMKVMNEVVSPIDGIVEAIQAKDGEMVEYDQILVVVNKE